MKINIYSEIDTLKTVLLHRPGQELENLTPRLLERLLFDDIPYLKVAQQEHDAFANALRKEGVEVLYLVDLAVETLVQHPDLVNQFIHKFIDESNVKSKTIHEALFFYLKKMPHEEMILKMISGIRTHDVSVEKKMSIMDLLEDEYPFYTDPMPNILFQRDPFSTIGRGVSIHRMHTRTRQRETLFSELILNYHKEFGRESIPIYYHRDAPYTIEGGDILILNEKTIAIGISKRTDPRAIEKIAKKVFANDDKFETILAFNIPKTRAFMHLDTVFTQINHHQFTIHPGILNQLTIFEILKKEDKIQIKKITSKLEDILEKHLQCKVELILCGGSDIIDSEREQWNDGANTLAIAPGTVIVYSRNHKTNQILRDKGIRVIEIPSSELSRGRGGPRCMSMPITRVAKN